ncbi:MAG: Glutamyl-tRNA(Gln) amidotransferase subunit A, partial [candidate division CPR2 bacterium GW2011_GWC2_39_10]
IGLPKEYFSDQVNAQVSATVKTAVKQLEKLGATVKEISLPLTQFAVPTYYVIVKYVLIAGVVLGIVFLTFMYFEKKNKK